MKSLISLICLIITRTLKVISLTWLKEFPVPLLTVIMPLIFCLIISVRSKMRCDKRYVRLIEDICWLKSDISSLVRLKCFDVARYQIKRMKRLIFLKSYVENLGYFPEWYDKVREVY